MFSFPLPWIHAHPHLASTAIFPRIHRFNFVADAETDVLEVHGTAGALRMSLFGADMPVTVQAGGRSVAWDTPASETNPEEAAADDVMSLACDGWLTLMVAVMSEVHLRRGSFNETQPVALELLRAGTTLATACTGRAALTPLLLCDSVLRRYYRDRLDAFWTRPGTWDTGLGPKATYAP